MILVKKHKQRDYLCPVNGICDIYEMKTGIRIPEYLLFKSNIGFTYVTQNNNKVKRQLFFSSGLTRMGEKQYKFLGKHLGINIISGENRSFGFTLKKIQNLIDCEIPVLLFGLDMYHITYQKKFYHTTHIEGHIVLMIGYDETFVFVYDNSFAEVQKIAIVDLELAWQNGYIDLSKRNAYFGLNTKNINSDVPNLLKSMYKEIRDHHFDSNVSIFGEKAFLKVQHEFLNWQKYFSEQDILEILNNIYTFTGSLLPETIEEHQQGILGFCNYHGGSRELLFQEIDEYTNILYGNDWNKVKKLLMISSKRINDLSIFCFEVVNKKKKFDNYEFLNLLKEIQEVDGCILNSL